MDQLLAMKCCCFETAGGWPIEQGGSGVAQVLSRWAVLRAPRDQGAALVLQSTLVADLGGMGSTLWLSLCWLKARQSPGRQTSGGVVGKVFWWPTISLSSRKLVAPGGSRRPGSWMGREVSGGGKLEATPVISFIQVPGACWALFLPGPQCQLD